MKEFNTSEALQQYILETTEKDDNAVKQFNQAGIPFVMVNNPEDVKIKGQQMKKDDKFVIYANGALELVKADKAKELTKTTFTKQELPKSNSSKFVTITLPSQSPNVGAYSYEFNKSAIGAYAKTEFQNKRNPNSKVTKFTLSATIAEKLNEIKENMAKFGTKAKNIEPSLQTDEFEVSDNFFKRENPMMKSSRFKEEFMKAPEQSIDETQKLIEQINDSIRKCEVFLGEMKEAQLASNAKGYDKAKGELQKEIAKLKELEIKAIKESKGQFAYDKIAGIKEINELQKLAQEADKEGPEKIHEKIKKHTKENYFVIYLNDMMNIRENLSKDEQLGIEAASAGTTVSGYGEKTKNAKTYRVDKENNSDVLSDIRDGSYNREYGALDGAANTTQQGEKDSVDDILDSPYEPRAYNTDYINRVIEEEDEREEERERTRFNN